MRKGEECAEVWNLHPTSYSDKAKVDVRVCHPYTSGYRKIQRGAERFSKALSFVFLPSAYVAADIETQQSGLLEGEVQIELLRSNGISSPIVVRFSDLSRLQLNDLMASLRTVSVRSMGSSEENYRRRCGEVWSQMAQARVPFTDLIVAPLNRASDISGNE